MPDCAQRKVDSPPLVADDRAVRVNQDSPARCEISRTHRKLITDAIGGGASASRVARGKSPRFREAVGPKPSRIEHARYGVNVLPPGARGSLSPRRVPSRSRRARRQRHPPT